MGRSVRGGVPTAVPPVSKVSEVPGAAAWVVLATQDDPARPEARSRSLEMLLQLASNDFSVLHVTVPAAMRRADAVAHVRAEAATLDDRRTNGQVTLYGGLGAAAVLAAEAAAGTDAAGLLSVDGSLFSIWWRLPVMSTPTLLVDTGTAGVRTGAGMRLSGALLGADGRRVAGDGVVASDLRDWRHAAIRGTWPAGPSRIRRLALPAAAAMLVVPGAAAVLTGTPVGAAQRSGDVSAHATGPSSKASKLTGHRLGAGQRHGDGLLPGPPVRRASSTVPA